jgi:transposase
MEKTEEIKKYLKFQRRLRALRLAEDLGCKYACNVFKISKTTFYNRIRKYDNYGEEVESFPQKRSD